MPRKKDDVKFEVVSHFTGEKTIKELLKNLIMREINDAGSTSSFQEIRRKSCKTNGNMV